MKTFIPCLFVFISGISFSQKKDTVESKPAFILKVSMGFVGANKLAFTNPEWERIAPGIPVPGSFTPNSTGIDSLTGEEYDGTYVIGALSFLNNKEKQAQKRYRTATSIHFGLGPVVGASAYWAHEDRRIIDTLISNQTGLASYVTGNRRQDIQKTYSGINLMLGLGQRIMTNPDHIVQFETGLDVFFLFTVNNEIKSYYTDRYIVEGGPESHYVKPALNADLVVKDKSRMIPGLFVRIPLEVSFKLSQTGIILKNYRVGLNLDPALGMEFTKGKVNGNFNTTVGFFFRYQFSSFSGLSGPRSRRRG
ncbi:MAG: hypothetical protein ACO1N0_11400 [Fluviicola sp.]